MGVIMSTKARLDLTILVTFAAALWLCDVVLFINQNT